MTCLAYTDTARTHARIWFLSQSLVVLLLIDNYNAVLGLFALIRSEAEGPIKLLIQTDSVSNDASLRERRIRVATDGRFPVITATSMGSLSLDCSFAMFDITRLQIVSFVRGSLTIQYVCFTRRLYIGIHAVACDHH